MAKRSVVWTKLARRQRREVLKYWTNRNHSTAYSEKLVLQILERTKLIAKKPLIYRETNFPNTRVASMGHYSLFYKVTDNKIIVTAFWDNRQDPNHLLEILKGNK